MSELCNDVDCFTHLRHDRRHCRHCGLPFCPRHVYDTFVDDGRVRRHTPQPMCRGCLSPWREEVLAVGALNKYDPVD